MEVAVYFMLQELPILILSLLPNLPALFILSLKHKLLTTWVKRMRVLATLLLKKDVEEYGMHLV